MKIVSFYHKDTGLFHSTLLTVSDDSIVTSNTPPDHLAIDGAHDCLSRRVDLATGKVVDYRPAQPSADHEWNGATRRWQLTQAAQRAFDEHRQALAAIARLEDSQHRALREHALGITDAADHLLRIDSEIAEHRKKLSQG